MARADKKILKIAFLLFKIAVSSALLVYLFSKVGGMAVVNNLVLISPVSFIAAALLYIAACYVSSLRWRLLVPYHIAMRWIFSTYMIGAFFNVCLPGTIGGDAVKAYYLSKELAVPPETADKAVQASNYGAVAIASVFMDRYIGLISLLLVGLTGTIMSFQSLHASPLLWVTPALSLAFIIFSILFFRFRLGSRIIFIRHMYDYFALYFGKRRVIVRALCYSAIIQLIVITSVYILAKGLLIDISFLQLLVFLPLISLISLVPISISGFGLREGAYVFFLAMVGIKAEMAMTLSILHFLSVAAASLWGFFEYLRFKHLFGGSIKEDSFKI